MSFPVSSLAGLPVRRPAVEGQLGKSERGLGTRELGVVRRDAGT
jgi:hypothetical protein